MIPFPSSPARFSAGLKPRRSRSTPGRTSAKRRQQITTKWLHDLAVDESATRARYREEAEKYGLLVKLDNLPRAEARKFLASLPVDVREEIMSPAFRLAAASVPGELSLGRNPRRTGRAAKSD